MVYWGFIQQWIEKQLNGIEMLIISSIGQQGTMYCYFVQQSSKTSERNGRVYYIQHRYLGNGIVTFHPTMNGKLLNEVVELITCGSWGGRFAGYCYVFFKNCSCHCLLKAICFSITPREGEFELLLFRVQNWTFSGSKLIFLHGVRPIFICGIMPNSVCGIIPNCLK